MLVDLDVVVRCRNEMPYTERTLAQLARQVGVTPRTLFIDCGSTDGSRGAAVSTRAMIVDLEPSRYVPGAVLNVGMEKTSSAVVAFVNADAVPLGQDALEKLIEPILRQNDVAASYGRQVARAEAAAITKADYGRTFRNAAEAVRLRRGVFFSMAASAIRREAWRMLPFDARLRYSEDVDWVQRAGALGWRTEFVHHSEFEHSHDYSPCGQYRRQAGEGAADTLIYRLGNARWTEDLVRRLAGSILKDFREGCGSIRSVVARAMQAAGYFSGRRRAARDEFEWYG